MLPLGNFVLHLDRALHGDCRGIAYRRVEYRLSSCPYREADRATMPALPGWVIVDLRSAMSLQGTGRLAPMNCFECAKLNDSVPAVGVCRRCGVGLCLDHLVETRGYRVGGTLFACDHEVPDTRLLRGVPAGVAGAARRHTAAVS